MVPAMCRLQAGKAESALAAFSLTNYNTLIHASSFFSYARGGDGGASGTAGEPGLLNLDFAHIRQNANRLAPAVARHL